MADKVRAEFNRFMTNEINTKAESYAKDKAYLFKLSNALKLVKQAEAEQQALQFQPEATHSENTTAVLKQMKAELAAATVAAKEAHNKWSRASPGPGKKNAAAERNAKKLDVENLTKEVASLEESIKSHSGKPSSNSRRDSLVKHQQTAYFDAVAAVRKLSDNLPVTVDAIEKEIEKTKASLRQNTNKEIEEQERQAAAASEILARPWSQNANLQKRANSLAVYRNYKITTNNRKKLRANTKRIPVAKKSIENSQLKSLAQYSSNPLLRRNTIKNGIRNTSAAFKRNIRAGRAANAARLSASMPNNNNAAANTRRLAAQQTVREWFPKVEKPVETPVKTPNLKTPVKTPNLKTQGTDHNALSAINAIPNGTQSPTIGQFNNALESYEAQRATVPPIVSMGPPPVPVATIPQGAVANLNSNFNPNPRPASKYQGISSFINLPQKMLDRTKSTDFEWETRNTGPLYKAFTDYKISTEPKSVVDIRIDIGRLKRIEKKDDLDVPSIFILLETPTDKHLLFEIYSFDRVGNKIKIKDILTPSSLVQVDGSENLTIYETHNTVPIFKEYVEAALKKADLLA